MCRFDSICEPCIDSLRSVTYNVGVRVVANWDRDRDRVVISAIAAASAAIVNLINIIIIIICDFNEKDIKRGMEKF